MASVYRFLLSLLVGALVFGPIHAHAQTSVTQYGTNGGYGENGGDLVLLDAASGSADYLYLYQYAYGGTGGYGDNSASPGNGGYASSFLDSSAGLGTYSTSYNVYAIGGQGGTGASGSSANGGLGGNALAGFSLVGAGDISGLANATGGNGGNVFGSGNGGNGGQATLATVYGASTSGGTVNVSGYATGGNGGNVFGSGNGGNGGQATASINNVANNLAASAVASGGGGGWSYNGGNGGQGGAATATVQATSSSSYVGSNASATGGSGGGVSNGSNSQAGNGGNAVASASGNSAAYYWGNPVTSNASGGGGGNVYTGTGSGGNGGAAAAQSFYTTSQNQYRETISANAYGGGGGQGLGTGNSGGQGGNANAMATGTSLGTLYVNSSATGGQGGSDSSGNFASAGNALATSTGTAASGRVGSYAISNLGNGYFVNGQASAPILNGTSISVAGTNVGQPLQTLADAQGNQAVAFGTALPSKIEAMLAQYQRVYYSFKGNGPVLGYGILGGMASGSGAGTYNSSLEYNLSIQGISNPQDLVVGLMGSSFSGPGFVSLEFSIVDQGQRLFDQTFSSAASAQAFFNNDVLDLGLLTSIPLTGSDLDLIFNCSLVASNNSGADFNFVYGNGTPQVIPLPGSALLLLTGLAGLGILRKKGKAKKS
jgi:hypothetical protein